MATRYATTRARCTAGAILACAAATLAQFRASAEEPVPDGSTGNRLALVAELIDEGAADEAIIEIADIRAITQGAARDAEIARLADFEARARAMLRGDGGKRRGILGLASSAFIGFYRFCIRPAIGSRCSLHPSCSEYFLEATGKHGPLGVPMMADRFFREPQATARGEIILLPDGTPRAADPISDHDFWLTK